ETGETIWTESSYKYTPTELAALAGRAGLAVEKVWTDPNRLFSVQYLTSRNA
ncbi:MAG: L-histidine N(alpha)-methyltransferase, partial [Anaerolineae bacterium]|nr:L-histidine N(alpha)-methyltransferase [Anaerolineae bacterium]